MNRAKFNFLPPTEASLPVTGTHPCWTSFMRTIQRCWAPWTRGSPSHHPQKQTHLCPWKLVDKRPPSPPEGQEQPIAWNKNLNLSPHKQNHSIRFISYRPPRCRVLFFVFPSTSLFPPAVLTFRYLLQYLFIRTILFPQTGRTPLA